MGNSNIKWMFRMYEVGSAIITRLRLRRARARRNGGEISPAAAGNAPLAADRAHRYSIKAALHD
jgi:hypothetical protein